VADQVDVLRIEDVRDGSVLTISRPYLVNINPEQEHIRVFVSGVEIDDTSANDPLPTAEHLSRNSFQVTDLE
jgi:hypothetical protein